MASSVAQLVKSKVESIPAGDIFDYTTFDLDTQFMTLASTLSRMAKAGTIVRLAKGKYYKPQATRFGDFGPTERAIINSLIFKNNRRIGYLTGIAVYNQLGLTSQIPNTVVIATNKPQRQKQVDQLKVRFVKRDAPIRDEDVPLLQLLDAIQDLKSIPDTSVDDALRVLIRKIKDLKEGEQKSLVKLALSYSASTRAILGAIVEQYIPKVNFYELSKSLNRLSNYKIGIRDKNLLAKRKNWNIKE